MSQSNLINNQTELMDALKHVQHIHYALVIACIILLLSLSRTDTKYSRALNQLHNINAIIHSIEIGWIHKLIYEKYIADEPYKEQLFNIGGYLADLNKNDIKDQDGKTIKIGNFRKIYIPKWWTVSKNKEIFITSLSQPHNTRLRADEIFLGKYHSKDIAYNNLRLIREFIHELQNIGNIYIIKNRPKYGWFRSNSKGLKTSLVYGTVPINILNKIYIASPYIVKDSKESNKGNIYKLEYQFVVNVENYEDYEILKKFEVPMDLNVIKINPIIRSLVREVTNINDFQLEAMEEHFGDLIKLPPYFNELPINNLESFLRAKTNTIFSDIKIFGINLPRANISRWGIILIVSFQLYLLLHFKSIVKDYEFNLQNRIPLIPSIICYHNDWLSKNVSRFTIVYLPLLANYFALNRVGYIDNNLPLINIVFVVVFFISIILAINLHVTINKWFKKIEIQL